ncbi:MAG: hypothetical protein ABFD76_05255 [Smithella sp.]
MINAATISFPFDENDQQHVIAYDASNRPEYIGRAPAGVATSVAQWQIRQLAYDAVTGSLLTVKFAGGVNDYNSVWDDRATLSYS